MTRLRFLLLVLLALPVAARAQVSTADEGSFTVTRRGEPAGREEFRIVRRPAGGGAEYVAQAVCAFGDRRIMPALQTDAAGTPVRYQVEVRAGGVSEQKLTGQLLRSRFSAQVQTPRGESAREYLAAEGVRIVDDDVYHHYYFLSLGTAAGSTDVPVIVPRRNAQMTWRVTRSAAPVGVEVGGRVLQAQHLTIRESGAADREVWVDSSGRVLRVSIPTLGILAVRDDPPR
jgi:hypothetical protein